MPGIRCRGESLLMLTLLSAPALAGGDGQTPFTEEAQLRGISYVCNQTIQFGDSIAFADLDDDGDPDLITLGSNTNLLGIYENDGAGFFTDRSAASGLPPLPKFSGVTAADYDRDGDLDLMVTRWGETDVFFRQTAPFTFEDITNEAGLGDPGRGTGATWSDYDLDGWLDLYVGNWDGGNRLYNCAGDATGAVQFVEIAELLGVHRAEQLTFQSSFLDYDRDGDADLYLTNSYGQHCADLPNRNLLFRNDGGTFVDVTEEANAMACVDAMCIGIGDVDGNGYHDIYVTDNNSPGNVLLLGQGDFFIEDAQGWNVESFATSWGSVFFDYDHDGILDLYVCNVGQPNRLYRHEGRPPMVDVSAQLNVDVGPGSYACATADVDGDGDLDLALSNRGEAVRLFINHEGEKRHWLKLDIVGRGAQRWAANAKADLRTGADWQLREVVIGSNYKAQNELILHWGLDAAKIADEIVVEWNGGETRVLRNLPANRTWTAYPDGKLGDADGDGDVDHDDAVHLLGCAGALRPGCEMMDFLGDGDVTGTDLALFMKRYVGTAPDCDGDGVSDYEAILVNGTNDANQNAVPDGCEHLGDLDGDERIDAADLAILLSLWGSTDPAGDLDGNGSVGHGDLVVLLSGWSA